MNGQRNILIFITAVLFTGFLWVSIKTHTSHQREMRSSLRFGMIRYYEKLSSLGIQTNINSTYVAKLLVSPEGELKLLPSFVNLTNVFIADSQLIKSNPETLLVVKHDKHFFRIDSHGTWAEWSESDFNAWSNLSFQLSTTQFDSTRIP